MDHLQVAALPELTPGRAPPKVIHIPNFISSIGPLPEKVRLLIREIMGD
jgi:hypothetical protein